MQRGIVSAGRRVVQRDLLGGAGGAAALVVVLRGGQPTPTHQQGAASGAALAAEDQELDIGRNLDAVVAVGGLSVLVVASRISVSSMAPNGQTSLQAKQPLHRLVLISATKGSAVRTSLLNRTRALADAAEAVATVSGMSLGA